MGGVDKGLQPFNGVALAERALARLAVQVGPLLVNANRNLSAYEALAAPFGAVVLPDAVADYAGPLAGFLAGLARCSTPHLLTVPCDTPLFPLDLAARLAAALERGDADIAMVSAPEDEGALRAQPVFCLLKASLHASLAAFTAAGGRKIDAWTAQHRTVLVPFDAAQDDPRAFANANTLDELEALET